MVWYLVKHRDNFAFTFTYSTVGKVFSAPGRMNSRKW